MPFYIIQDSDWDWDNDEGGTAPPIIVEAPISELALTLGAVISFGRDKWDGACLMVAEIKASGFQGFERGADGQMVSDKYTSFSSDQEAKDDV